MPNIESENKFLTSITGYNFGLICQHLPICNPKTLIHNIDSHTKFEENRYRNAKDREWKPISITSIKGRNSLLICQNLPICYPWTLLSNINSHSKFKENWLKKPPAESENDALTDGRTDGRTDGCTDGWTDGRTLERNFLNRGYNIIPRTF